MSTRRDYRLDILGNPGGQPQPASAATETLALDSLLLFDLSAPEAVEEFRDAACKLLEKAGELSPEVQASVDERARTLGVHPLQAVEVQREILTLPSVMAAFEAVNERKRDGPYLAGRVRDAKPGEVILLERGRYRFSEPLVIRTPIRLIGAGATRTFLMGEAGECVVRIESGGSVLVEGVSFEYRGPGPGDGVVVQSGDAELLECRFAWAVSNAMGERGGCGLLVRSGGSVTVTKCLAERNARAGIYVEGGARPRLDQNQAALNDGCGIVFAGKAEGVATGNRCAENHQHGIAVRDRAAPVLEENVCEDNRRNGIDYSERARGAACLRNICERNRGKGICISGTGEGRLDQNTCTDNAEAGIALYGRAKVDARDNRCRGLQRYGILADRTTDVLLEDNHCASAEEAGIVFLGTARGSARKNYVEGCPAGILVEGQARPLLEENRCEGNSFAGIWFGPRAGGQAVRNECHGNLYGIFRTPPNRSALKDNNCAGNKAGTYGGSP